MLIGVLLGIVLGITLIIGGLQTLGETRLTIIFPVISALAVLLFLAHCMFSGPTHP
jgi:hypothetical protein